MIASQHFSFAELQRHPQIVVDFLERKKDAAVIAQRDGDDMRIAAARAAQDGLYSPVPANIMPVRSDDFSGSRPRPKDDRQEIPFLRVALAVVLNGYLDMLHCDDTALLLIDVQEKLLRVMHEKDQLVTHLCQLVKGARALGVPVIWFEQNPAGLGATIPELAELLAEQTPIIKQSFNCCAHPGVWPHIEQLRRRHFLLAGIETHICVYQTGMELLQHGYDAQIVSDAVSSRTAENKQLGITRIQQGGGQITSVEMALFELLKVAEGPTFKEILRIIK